jgi:UDP:flavonoid glycosyltransferase YjiC (YdhE family)
LYVLNHNLPRWLNRFTWWFTKRIDNLAGKKMANRKRRELGLKPIRDGWSHLLGSRVIVATDRALGVVPNDVTQDHVQTGYLHLHQTGELGADVEAFVASGPPPIYVGFGSMPDHNPEKTTRLVVEAVRAAGQRVILSCGWAGIGHRKAAEDYYVVDDVPHPLLFPRMSAVIHHGGAGTTATAAQAGVPQIIVPHVLDQYYWASRVYRAGLGPRPIARSRLTEKRLGAAIRECVSSETMRLRAREVGEILQRQDSVGLAVRLIESEFSGNNSGASPI